MALTTQSTSDQVGLFSRIFQMDNNYKIHIDKQEMIKANDQLSPMDQQIGLPRKKVDDVISILSQEIIFQNNLLTMRAKELGTGEGGFLFIENKEEEEKYNRQAQIANAVSICCKVVSHGLWKAQKLCDDGKISNFTGLISLYLETRTLEMALLRQSIDRFQDHEDHELFIMTMLHAEQVQQEEAEIERMIKKAQENEAIDFQLIFPKNEPKEEGSITERDLKDQKLVSDSKFEELKKENQKKIESLRIKAEMQVIEKKANSSGLIKKNNTLKNECSIM